MSGGLLLCRMQILVHGGALGFGCFGWICVHVLVTCGCVGWMFVVWLFVDVFEAVFGGCVGWLLDVFVADVCVAWLRLFWLSVDVLVGFGCVGWLWMC